MNVVEQGVPHDGIRPRLVQEFGPLGYMAATDPDRTMSDVLNRRLHRLDGKKFGFYIISVQSGELQDVDDLDGTTLLEYIQSAGSAESMTVEIKRREEDGVLRQYAVGRAADEPGMKTVSWAPDHSERVPAYEVFTAEQAHPVYLQWCWDQTIPHGYRLRLLDI